MQTKYWWIIFAGLVITLIGLVTKKFFFFLFFLPIGYLFQSQKSDDETKIN